MSAPPTIPSVAPFSRGAHLDKPAIIGALWWQQSMANPVARRDAVRLALLGGAAVGVAMVGGGIAAVALSRDEDTRVDYRSALAMQREFGWDFGAAGEDLVWNGESLEAFDRARLHAMVQEFSPASPSYLPFFVPTLFESPTAERRSVAQGDPATFVPLREVLRPIHTPAMDTAFQRGQSLSTWFNATGRRDTAVLVDLPGPEAVAFAAGASDVLDPVFAIDNWPHPQGVVPAHLALAAAAYYQPLLAKSRVQRRSTAAPLWVLDRMRLTPYADDADQFDNRHMVTLPSAATFVGLGFNRLLYITPKTSDVELDDLNDDFANMVAAHMAIDRMGLDEVSAALAPGKPMPAHLGANYAAVPRATGLVDGHSGGLGLRRFGQVPVMLGAVSGAVLGAQRSRNGSWNRVTSIGGG